MLITEGGEEGKYQSRPLRQSIIGKSVPEGKGRGGGGGGRAGIEGLWHKYM